MLVYSAVHSAVTNFITSMLTTNPYVVVTALDFSKAFNAVRHHILLCKLAQLDISNNVSNWIASFLSQQSHNTIPEPSVRCSRNFSQHHTKILHWSSFMCSKVCLLFHMPSYSLITNYEFSRYWQLKDSVCSQHVMQVCRWYIANYSFQ